MGLLDARESDCDHGAERLTVPIRRAARRREPAPRRPGPAPHRNPIVMLITGYDIRIIHAATVLVCIGRCESC
jgi:hypothetical protein